MESYLPYSPVKVFVKSQQKTFDFMKTKNIGICHYRPKAILPSYILIDDSRKLI